MNVVKFVLLNILVLVAMAFVYNCLLGGVGHKQIVDDSLVWFILKIVVLSPIMETLIFQSSIIIVLKYLSDIRNVYAILISACVFGLMHFYTPMFVIWGVLSGLIFASAFVLRQNYGNKTATITVIAIHMLYNGIMIALRFIGL